MTEEEGLFSIPAKSSPPRWADTPELAAHPDAPVTRLGLYALAGLHGLECASLVPRYAPYDFFIENTALYRRHGLWRIAEDRANTTWRIVITMADVIEFLTEAGCIDAPGDLHHGE